MISGLLIVLAGFGGIAVGWYFCTRYQVNSLTAALTVTEIGTESADRILKAAEEQAKLAISVEALVGRVEKSERSVSDLARSVDAFDQNQGAILNGLINTGIIRSVSGGGVREEQVGESPLTRTPVPDFDAGEPATDRPLDDIVT